MGNPEVRVADKNLASEKLAERCEVKRLGARSLDRAAEDRNFDMFTTLNEEYRILVANLAAEIEGNLGETASVVGRPSWFHIVTNNKGPEPLYIDMPAYPKGDKQRIPQNITGELVNINEGELTVRNGGGDLIIFPIEDIDSINLPMIAPVTGV
ncbi:MAG TPA: hypothetical protein VHB51_02700 [Candidatus Saccharimonadales bacterium]|nr:hypothetical protein [Candidatus Saccharimonadales bacterium]